MNETGATGWRPSRRSDAFDVAVVAALALAGGLSLYVGGDPALVGPLADYPRGLGVGALAALILVLVVRRRYPLVALVVAAAGLCALRLADVPEFQVSGVALFVALYTAGAYGGAHRDAVRATVAAAVVALVVWTIVREPPVPFEGRVPAAVLNLLTAVANAFYLVAGWILGDLVRNRRQREARLEAQATELALAQAELAHQAVMAERVRIARELHDVLAHHVSVMGVQAGAARRVLPTQPDEVPELLSGIEWSSRQAVVELQRLVGLLRQPGDDDGVDEPQPTLARLADLAEHMREAGLDVHVELDPAGEAVGQTVPAAVELAAYRIVQEALTNTLKHAGEGARATVEVRREPSALALAVGDDGRAGAGQGGPGSGHGLVGMRERVALHGGELRAGRAQGGGFEVRAWFPLDGRAASAGPRS